jgi:hypothetical protein
LNCNICICIACKTPTHSTTLKVIKWAGQSLILCPSSLTKVRWMYQITNILCVKNGNICFPNTRRSPIIICLGRCPGTLKRAGGVLMMMGIPSRMVPAVALTTAIPHLADRGAFMNINSMAFKLRRRPSCQAELVEAYHMGTYLVQPFDKVRVNVN